MTKYTFTFDQQDEGAFKKILSRLDEDEYNVIEDTRLVDDTQPRYSQKQTVIEMESDSCLTIRMGMGNHVKIRRERTEEELAEEQAQLDRHKVKITVLVPPDQMPGAVTPKVP